LWHARIPSDKWVGLFFVIALTVIAPPSVLALTFADIEVTCPIDGKTFTAKIVASFTKTGVRLDLKPIGFLVAPHPLPVCPGNGFVMDKLEYADEEVAKLKAIVADETFKAAREKHTDYYMVAFVQERLGADKFDIAWSYLQASWEAEKEWPDHLQEYMALAIAGFDSYLKGAKKHSKDWWTAQIIAANLERRLGRFAAARQRIASLEFEALASTSPFRQAIDQIMDWAEKHNTQPQKFVSP